MRLRKSGLTSNHFLWAIAALLLTLTACTSAPTKPPLVLPAIQLPPREKPVAAMQPIQPPPAPVAISQMPKAQQAEAATLLYTITAGVAGECLKSRDVLIQWINGD